ncbi:GTP 3',8-cyclase MoaA [Oxalobacteraceae bacterium CAVE-383]|nr:GTP 3',8-cyclase MoaA [Oxalobacteraceae bacterium CAVE-383]
MTVIPIHDIRQRRPAAASPPAFAMDYPPDGQLLDQLGRPLRDLRISVTDRCNFRCVYCMPKEIFDKDYRFLPHSALLSFEEIERVAKVFVAHGVQKIRLTGGEPLLRKNLERLVDMLRKLPTPDGKPLDLTLTTNGALLAKKAQALKDAGLDRVTVSLDSLDDANFKRMNDADFPVSQVLEGIDAAHRAGLGPIKINMVVKKGVNDHEILAMARHFRNTPYVLRFIEYMDVGSSNGWRMDEVLPSDQLIARIAAELPLSPVGANYPGETASRWRYDDGGGEIGVISSVTHAFCGDCNRARLSTEGKLYTCLFGTAGHDLRALLRSEGGDDSSRERDLANAIGHIWGHRADRYSESRAAHAGEPIERIARKVEMSYIGG